MKVSYAYEAGTSSVTTTGSSVGAVIGSGSIAPVLMGHQSTSLSSTLLAGRLTPPVIDREDRTRNDQRIGTIMLVVGSALVYPMKLGIDKKMQGLYASAAFEGLLMLAAIVVAIVGLVKLIIATNSMQQAIEDDKRAWEELKIWNRSWLCTACGHKFEWEHST